MNAKSLAVSHVLAVSLGVVVGYGLNEAITTESPGVTPAPQSLKTEPKQARQEKTMRPEKPSVAPTELGQAREQIASLQAECKIKDRLQDASPGLRPSFFVRRNKTLLTRLNSKKSQCLFRVDRSA